MRGTVARVADVPARPREDACSWTPTGVRLAVDELTLQAEDLDRDRYGQKAIVSIWWGDRLCYRERLNFDAAGEREKFVARLARACRQADRERGAEPWTLIVDCVTDATLIQLGEACRRRPAQQLSADGVGKPARTAAARAAEERARVLLNDPDVLFRVGEAMQASGYVGRRGAALLAYLALTSRFLERPINLALVGPSAAGKNATLDAALQLVPPKAVSVWSAGSPTALIYAADDFQHRVVVFKEADSIPDRGPAASAIRGLAEDAELRYAVATLNRRTGRFETQVHTKPGPTGLLTTSTRPLRPQLNTRVLQVPVAEDEGTTEAVMQSEGRRAAGNAPPPPDLRAFLALQEWLALAAERRVRVPFGEQLAHLMPPPSHSRLRRDFKQLVSCVQTMAFLRQCQRERAPGGEVLATIDDYASVRGLLLPSFKTAVAESVSGAIRQTVQAVGQWEENVSEQDLVARRGLPKQTISDHVRVAIANEWLKNAGPPWRRPYRLKRGNPLPTQVAALPEVRELQFAVDGIPAPVLEERCREFAAYLTERWPQGFRADELAARLGWDTRAGREGLAALRAAQLLLLDETTALFSVPPDLWQHGFSCAGCIAKAPCARCRSLAAEAAIAALEAAGSTGMTVLEWAARVGCEPAAVRVQFDGWFREKLLRHAPATDRYSLPLLVKEHLAWVRTFHGS